jgi:putative transposase
MPKTRLPYPQEFRQRMVDLVCSRWKPEELSQEFEPLAQAIRNWVRQADGDQGIRADGLITEGREILKKAAAWFYASRSRPRSHRTAEDSSLLDRIRAVHTRSRGTYGAPRIHAELAEEGRRVGRKRIARLMRAVGLRGVCGRRFVATTVRSESAKPAPDLVQRRFSVERPNQLWVADITYIPTRVGFLYLAVVLDAWSRCVVGWTMETHLRTELVLQALHMATHQRASLRGDPPL